MPNLYLSWTEWLVEYQTLAGKAADHRQAWAAWTAGVATPQDAIRAGYVRNPKPSWSSPWLTFSRRSFSS